MTKNRLSIGSLLIALVLFFAVNIFSNAALNQWRIDLTENKLYTLADGTRNILTDLQEPITLRFFLSREVATNVPAIASYAQRVEDLLREYERQAHGRINLKVIDPEPFSEEEDLAQRYGLRSIPVNDSGDPLYFGLVGTNSVDDTEALPFFSPDREKLLEYDLTRLIHQLTQTEPPVVGLVSPLPLKASLRMGQRGRRSWLIVDQIEQLFVVENIDSDESRIPDSVDILMVVHPGELSDGMMYAMDQFVLSGGRALVFVDPYMEAEARGRGATQSRSDLTPLLATWGVELVDDEVAADMRFAERVRYRQEQRVVIGEFPVWLNVQPSYFNGDDVVTANLGNVFLATAGVLEKREDAQTDFTPLIQSSSQADRIDASLVIGAASPTAIIEAYEPGSRRLTLAARISGPADTAFPAGPPEPREPSSDANAESRDETSSFTRNPRHVEAAQDINVIVVADVDMLHERFWAQRQNLLGNQIVVPSASNADFVINALENLTGGNDLISVRSRGQFSRPFIKTAEIRQSAELKYRQKEQELLDRLEQTEQALLELEQGKRNEQDQLMLSEEQQQEIMQFRDEKIRIRKELRKVQHQLRKDIDALEGWLKFINIGLLPLLIVTGATTVRVQRARRHKR